MDTHRMSDPITFLDIQGLPAIQINSPDGAQATVLLQGGHVLSWIPAGNAGEQLYLSPQAEFSPGKAIRGGVPVVFPQFEKKGPDRSLPRHGFARNRPWTLDSQSHSASHAQATFQLTDNDETRALWPHGFELELTVSVSGTELELELYVHNTGTTAWPFSAALHTYLAISGLDAVRLQGLEGCEYTDSLTGFEGIEDHPEKRFSDEFDRIYDKATNLLLMDGTRRLSVQSDNLSDAVVWNPGPDKCAALADMPADGWQHMLCVEAARVLHPKTLSPDEDWVGRQSLTLRAV
jgi:glucose-6-phosphate 1-epimerase